jgi:hypothetical protein
MDSEKVNEFKAYIRKFIDANGEKVFSKRIHWENIPEKIAINATKGLKIPSDETIMMMIDASLFGSGKEGLALTDWGARYNDGVDAWNLTWNDISEKYNFVIIKTDGAWGIKVDELLLQVNSEDEFTVNKPISMSMADIKYNVLARILSKTCQIFTGKNVALSDTTIEKTQTSEEKIQAPESESQSQPEPKQETPKAPEKLTPMQEVERKRWRKEDAVQYNPPTDFSYKLNEQENGIIITKYIGTSRNLIIPPSIEGYPVVQIGEECRASTEMEAQKNRITQKPIDILVIPQGVKEIPTGRFCSRALKKITLPIGLEIIRKYAFYNTSLTSVTIPSTVKWIEKEAFGFCTELTEVSLPDTLEYLPDRAFGSCKNLTKINIPAKIKTFGGLGGSESLRELIIPDNLEYRFSGGGAIISFLGCQQLPLATRKRLKELGYTGDF